MGIFGNKKISLEDAIRTIVEYAESNDEENAIIMLRGKKNSRGKFELSDGALSCPVLEIPQLLIEAAKNDEHFLKALVTTSESLIFNLPEMAAFAQKLKDAAPDRPQRGADGRMEDIEKKLREKFPGAEVMSIDITKIKDMDEDSFQDVVDKIYRASQESSNRRDGDKG